MAGGKSRRFGSDKATAVLCGRTLLEHVVASLEDVAVHVVVVGRAAGPPSRLPVVCVQDVFPDRGSLGGLYSGLVAAPTDWSLALACDMPLVSRDLVRWLAAEASSEVDVVMPRLEEPEPLLALYHRRCAEPIRRRLEAGALKMTGFLDDVRVRWVGADEVARADGSFASFLNVNTPSDFARAKELLEARRGG